MGIPEFACTARGRRTVRLCQTLTLGISVEMGSMPRTAVAPVRSPNLAIPERSFGAQFTEVKVKSQRNVH